MTLGDWTQTQGVTEMAKVTVVIYSACEGVKSRAHWYKLGLVMGLALFCES